MQQLCCPEVSVPCRHHTPVPSCHIHSVGAARLRRRQMVQITSMATSDPVQPMLESPQQGRARIQHVQASAQQATTSQLAGTQQPLITLEEVQQAAHNRGLEIYVRELGPFYRIVCREGKVSPQGQEENPQQGPNQGTSQPNQSRGTGRTGQESDEAGGGKILALTTGFVAPPFGLMHCDTLQVFTKGLRGDDGDRVRGGALGLGLLMGGAVFSYGRQRGCRKAEILAIDDDTYTHERLVKYYSFFGFKPVARVTGGELSDLPHMLVWGGAGTRMDADVEAMLTKWTPSLRRAAARRG